MLATTHRRSTSLARAFGGLAWPCAFALALGCGDMRPIEVTPDAGVTFDATTDDSGREAPDGGDRLDGSSADGGLLATDAGHLGDTGLPEGGTTDAGVDAGSPAAFDAGTDAGSDAGTDAGFDAGVDGGMGDCISGAPGNRAVRFRFAGSGSTAYVVHEVNQLPDTSRWRARALSMNIGYTPVFADIFLGEGGLDMPSSVFIDVELSTASLASVRSATLAIYGRSFNTTSSGSFSWQTFSGTGAAPSGSVPNSAPYQWVGAIATSALPAGDDGTLLRIRPGGPSNRLVVNRVEICFDAD